jgi:hypothetical protein
MHPLSLEAIIKKYLVMRGWAVNRGNEILSSAAKRGTLHGIHPHGMPSFDINWRFVRDVILEPMEERLGERGQNILYWDQTYMNYLYKGYAWRSVGYEEEKEILEYFASPHFAKIFDLVLDPSILHIHVNVETCIHPIVLERFFVKALGERKWKVFRTIPCVYIVKGIYYGKIMFYFLEPEVSFDFAWIYNQTVTLGPCTREIFPLNKPEYLIVKREDYDKLLSEDNYVKLGDEEIQRCLRSVEI